MTKPEAVAVVAKLMLAYPREGNPDVIELYAEHLLDCDRDRTLRAVSFLIKTAKWLPTVAELRDAMTTSAPREPPVMFLGPPKPEPPAEVQGRVKVLVDDLLASWGQRR